MAASFHRSYSDVNEKQLSEAAAFVGDVIGIISILKHSGKL